MTELLLKILQDNYNSHRKRNFFAFAAIPLVIIEPNRKTHWKN